MYFFTLATLLPLFLALTLAAPIPQATSTTCSTRYPITITDISDHRQGFKLHVKANNLAYSNHNVQLRTLSSGVQLVVVDKDLATLPVLSLKLRNGTLYGETVGRVNDATNLGPTGVLTNTTDYRGYHRQLFQFSNTSSADTPLSYNSTAVGGEVNTRDVWTLENLGDDGTYWLYHDVPIGIAHGFLICPVRQHWQLYYYESTDVSEVNLGECESVALEVSSPILDVEGG